MDKLFISFSQVDASHTKKYGGTGLGLAISRQLVEMMGGRLNVDSKKGEGSVFYFSLKFEKASNKKENFKNNNFIFMTSDKNKKYIISIQCEFC